jgi:hypothetical protein
VIAFAIFGCVLLTFRGCAGSPAGVQTPPGVSARVLADDHPSEAGETSVFSTIWFYCCWGIAIICGAVLGLVVLAVCAVHWKEILVAAIWLVIVFCVVSWAIFVVIGAITIVTGILTRLEDR